VSNDACIITENLTEAMRFFGRAREDAEVHELPGVSVIYCGLDYAAFNAGVLSKPIAGDSAALQERVHLAANHFARRKLRWSYWYCDDYVGKPFLRRAKSLLEQHGMSELTEAPGMITDRLAEPSRQLPALEMKPVADPATRSAFAHVTSIAFEVPWTVCREVYGTERAWSGSFRGYVGFANGMAVSTTAIVVTAGVAGVYSVGTLPAYRSRGYAEALMRQALDQVRNETGIQRTALQSTRSGFNLYSKMGYRRATSYTVFISD
jgi:ribosomal protein S18 acetylase RimI-like enzyme